MLNLTIHHNVYLTKRQRYALHEGIELVVTGVCVPIWCFKNHTSEPGREVFCRYYLKNQRKDYPIQIQAEGFEISIPYREGKTPPLSDEQWREWNLKDPSKLEEYYKTCVSEVSSKNLLDPIDGGGRCLTYREHNQVKKDKTLMKILHYVNIEDEAVLTESLTLF